MDHPAIAVKNLKKSVTNGKEQLHILTGVDLNIKKGAKVAIVGVSGAGKSTLLALLAGLDTPTEGSVAIDGTVLGPLTEDEKAQLRASKVGFVFQSFQLVPGLSALENVMLPMEFFQASRPELTAVVIRQQALQWLQAVGLEERVAHYPNQLSGGEQQRVAIARAFATEPAVVFADEPTGNLDPKSGEHIVEVLMGMNQDKDTTLVLVTHDLELAHQCEWVYRLEQGHLIEEKAP